MGPEHVTCVLEEEVLISAVADFTGQIRCRVQIRWGFISFSSSCLLPSALLSTPALVFAGSRFTRSAAVRSPAGGRFV